MANLFAAKAQEISKKLVNIKSNDKVMSVYHDLSQKNFSKPWRIGEGVIINRHGGCHHWGVFRGYGHGPVVVRK